MLFVNPQNNCRAAVLQLSDFRNSSQSVRLECRPPSLGVRKGLKIAVSMFAAGQHLICFKSEGVIIVAQNSA